MPTIHVEMLSGRTEEQKERIAQRLTQVLIDEAGARPESVHVIFQDVSPRDWAVAGKLLGKPAA